MEDFGRWCVFGVFLKKHGNGGTITLPYSVTVLLRLLRLSDGDSVRNCLSRFPHCDVEVLKNGDDHVPSHIKVTWQNWHKYQVDSSRERMRKYRANVTAQKRSRSRREEDVTSPPFSSTSKPLAGPYGG